MQVSPQQIFPSQAFLKSKTVRYILDCIQKGELDKLPPPPIVRKDTAGRLIAIDGHNLIAVMLYLGKDIEVHVAASREDGLLPSSPSNTRRNTDLHEKYESVLSENQRLHDEGIDSFADLNARYPDLFAS